MQFVRAADIDWLEADGNYVRLHIAGRAHLFDAPHLTIFPGLAIALLVLGFNFLGDGLLDRTDAKLVR